MGVSAAYKVSATVGFRFNGFGVLVNALPIIAMGVGRRKSRPVHTRCGRLDGLCSLGSRRWAWSARFLRVRFEPEPERKHEGQERQHRTTWAIKDVVHSSQTNCVPENF